MTAPSQTEQLKLLDEVFHEAADEAARRRIQRIFRSADDRSSFDANVECLFWDATADEYLFRFPAGGRMGDDRYFFILGRRVLEVLRLGHYSTNFSFQHFPRELEPQRPQIQAQFVLLVKRSGQSLGWCEGPWDGLSDGEKALCEPVFIADDRCTPDDL